jgi:ribosome biogenesis GTPase
VGSNPTLSAIPHISWPAHLSLGFPADIKRKVNLFGFQNDARADSNWKSDVSGHSFDIRFLVPGKKHRMSNDIKKDEIEDLGYDAFFESGLKESKLSGNSAARVIAEYKEAYRVRSATGEYLARITGRRMFGALSREDYPAVGDWVAVTELDEDRAVIHGILPRKTILKKKYSRKHESQIIATNIDVAFIVESVDGDYNLNRFERYFVLADDGKITPAIILNKIDLISAAELNLKLAQLSARFKDAAIIPTSTITERGLDELRACIMKGKTYCFLGSSGVGKSSLINKLLGRSAIKVSEISGRTGRGRHTTTSREIYVLQNGGIVIDNPGMKEVGMVDSSAGIEDVFDDITALSKKCRYVDCTHAREPGCSVLNAVKSKELDENRYLNYLKLKKETDFYAMTELEKRRKDRQFGKMVKKALDQLKKYE